jgi:prepilin peptidase CpaA
MSPALSEITVVVALVLIVGAALHDIAVRTVPNCVGLALLPIGLILRLLSGDLLLGLGLAAAVFAVAFVLWLLGVMGGGDTKLFGAVALVAPPDRLPHLLLAIALCGGVLALFYLIMSYVVTRPRAGRPRTIVARIAKAERWRLSRRGPLPYAVAIAGGSVLSLLSLVAV